MSSSPSPPAWQTHELSSIDQMRHLLGNLVGELRDHGYSDKEQFAVRLTLEEAIVNSIKHGHHSDPSKHVTLRYRVDGQRFEAEVTDQGPGFDPQALPNPLAPENLELPGGRGVFLMRHYMTSVEYNARGNCVILVKTRETGAGDNP